MKKSTADKRMNQMIGLYCGYGAGWLALSFISWRQMHAPAPTWQQLAWGAAFGLCCAFTTYCTAKAGAIFGVKLTVEVLSPVIAEVYENEKDPS